ncbi:SusC/RagA family TonB-linked outer membrane protein [Mucilaginibacter myungsuensis]|uniref:SusC/RagA family TonB-linked outer membrane protein n=1 Tax=Mucilaginibacter myungsuensis TaxID=649104 RepID=A0A929L1Y7_9SPHI|nr:SusC/RagA family TonB-linked outer membrane protein [Mucilaginibacter myungsuensis]MBE9664133.1 SusC/RagA family TonB-linked outer membrane protein [Mucilaginibacter myungsuensis]MDN3601312.1 SusC/RagA family TonB-linked outer membrane protein [Mucilaginibacter myungsuensis]
MKKLLLASLCFLLLCASQVYAQSRTVTGTVTAKDDGLPLPGVSVKVTGTTIGTQTNASGKFTLSVPATAKSLTFSFVGFNPEVVNIGGGAVNAVLSSNTKDLAEVVVTAGGLTATKGSQGYATTAIKPQELTQGKAVNVGAALSGKVAGLQVNAVSSGVNPTVRIVLRGNRSLTGNNQALIVMDNVIVPSSILGNINPEDVEDIQVLNGSQGAALYGSDASNGAIIITTKKGKKGQAVVKASQTISGEKVSYYPQLQTGFGSGADADVQLYITHENQQYGPAYNGQMVQLGDPLVDGRVQMVPYSFNNSKNDFWETGVQKQSDFSVSSGDDKGNTYVAGQYFTNTGTTPGDKYNRLSIRANGGRQLANKVSVNFTTNYVKNNYDISSATANIYDQLMQTPGHVVVTDYKDYINNPFATVDGYYNFYYANPYFTAANQRQNTRNDYLVGTTELKYDPASFLNLTFRVGLTASNAQTQTTVGKYETSAYTKSLGGGAVKNNNEVGSVSEDASYNSRVTTELYATFKKQIQDFNLNATLGASMRQDKSNDQNVGAVGLVQAGLYNVGVRTQPNVTGSESQSTARQQAVYTSINVGYKGYLNLHLTGRNDWLSVLAPENRSFFYPAADVSFIPTEAIDFLKNNKVLSSLKIRGGISRVGNANIGPYGLVPIFSPGNGYPFPSGPGYNQGNGLTSPDLKPEITDGFEVGTDADLFNGRITASVTYFKSKTTKQTVSVNISNATGFSSYQLNSGRMDNQGIESALAVVPIKTATGWQLTLGANFTWLDNTVKELAAGLDQLNLGNGIVARPGLSYPQLTGTDYVRDDQGRIIVNRQTGYPTATTNAGIIGNTNPRQRVGTNFELKYKSLRLAALAEYRGGFIVNNSVSGSFDFSGSGIRNTYYNRERFVVPNSSYLDPTTNTYVANNNITVADGGYNFWTQAVNTGVTTNYVTNGASWKLREASLSWDVPKSLIGRQKYVKGATLQLQGRNLFLWLPKSQIYTDPEYNAGSGNAIGVNSVANTPPTRYYGATLSLTF